MPFYKIFCIAVHYPEYKHIKDLVMQSARLIMDQGGVVRTINSTGTQTLPQRMRRHKYYHEIGDYWTMHFDASPNLMRLLNNKLRADPRVIRWTTLKLGDRLDNVIVTKQQTSISPSDARDYAMLSQTLNLRDMDSTTFNPPAFAQSSGNNAYQRPRFR